MAFNYNTIEGFCCEVANGNPFILYFIMHVSQLFKHEVAKFYRGGVEFVLKTGRTANLGRALSPMHSDAYYNNHLEELCSQAKQIREVSFKEVKRQLAERGEYQFAEDEFMDGRIRNKISSLLVRFYDESPTPGILSKSIMDSAVSEYFEKRIICPKEKEAYYLGWFNCMENYNKEMKKLNAMSGQRK